MIRFSLTALISTSAMLAVHIVFAQSTHPIRSVADFDADSPRPLQEALIEIEERLRVPVNYQEAIVNDPAESVRGEDIGLATGKLYQKSHHFTVHYVPGESDALSAAQTAVNAYQKARLPGPYKVVSHGSAINAPGSNPNGDVLRHFDSSGKVIDSLIPRSRFRSSLRIIYGYLEVTHDRLGWYGPDQGKGEYTEVALDTKKERTFPAMPVQPSSTIGPAKVLGFALTDSNKAYLTCDLSSGARTTYMLDRASEAWVALNVPVINGMSVPVLNGVEGEQLVFRGGDALGFLEQTN